MTSHVARVLCLAAAAFLAAAPAFAGGGKRDRGRGSNNASPSPQHDPRASDPRANHPTPATPGPADGIATPGAVRADRAAAIEMGAPIQFHNISVVPVITRRTGPFQRYTLLEAGLAKKSIDVRELDGNSSDAQVNAVEVSNRGDQPLYLLGGEMILGGKQDRIIARDTVVAAGGEWVKVAVFCVEAGRWQGQNMQFHAGKAMADVSVRRAAMTDSQSEVWREVDKKNVLHGTQSATNTYRRTIQNADVRGKIRPYVSELKSRLPADGRLAGLVFGINGKIHVADIFGNPLLFGDLSDKLLAAYVLEALGHQVVPGAEPVSTRDARQFVGKARSAKSKKVTQSGRAKGYTKEDDDFIGAQTVDDGTGETVRETYIGK